MSTLISRLGSISRYSMIRRYSEVRMKVSPIESSRGNTPIASIHVVAGQPFFVYNAESLLRCAPRILFRPLRLLRFSFSVCSSCRLTLLPSPLFSFVFLLPSFLFYFFSPFRFCSTSLFLSVTPLSDRQPT